MSCNTDPTLQKFKVFLMANSTSIPKGVLDDLSALLASGEATHDEKNGLGEQLKRVQKLQDYNALLWVSILSIPDLMKEIQEGKREDARQFYANWLQTDLEGFLEGMDFWLHSRPHSIVATNQAASFLSSLQVDEADQALRHLLLQMRPWTFSYDHFYLLLKKLRKKKVMDDADTLRALENYVQGLYLGAWSDIDTRKELEQYLFPDLDNYPKEVYWPLLAKITLAIPPFDQVPPNTVEHPETALMATQQGTLGFTDENYYAELYSLVIQHPEWKSGDPESLKQAFNHLRAQPLPEEVKVDAVWGLWVLGCRSEDTLSEWETGEQAQYALAQLELYLAERGVGEVFLSLQRRMENYFAALAEEGDAHAKGLAKQMLAQFEVIKASR